MPKKLKAVKPWPATIEERCELNLLSTQRDAIARRASEILFAVRVRKGLPDDQEITYDVRTGVFSLVEKPSS